jgi:hypothetical protein
MSDGIKPPEAAIEGAEPVALSRLRLALQVLAASAHDQIAHFPDFVCVADEMALDYNLWLTRVRERVPLAPDHIAALTAIDTYLAERSGGHNSAFWTNAALTDDPGWADVRRLAQDGLRALGWPVEPPPPSPDVYIPAKPSQ